MFEQTLRKTYTFTRQIQLLAIEFRKNFEELLHETNELSCKVVLILYVWGALRKSCANRLLHPQDGGEIGPALFIHRGFGLTIGPTERL